MERIELIDRLRGNLNIIESKLNGNELPIGLANFAYACLNNAMANIDTFIRFELTLWKANSIVRLANDAEATKLKQTILLTNQKRIGD